MLTPRSSAYTAHAPILIEGDGNFTAANGVVGGNGTSADPYVIAGWEIDASIGTGIQIQNTSAHFIIQDVRVHSGGLTQYGAVQLWNVANAVVRNSTFDGNRYGVSVRSASNVTIAFNNATANGHGILVSEASSDLTVANNTIASSPGYAIRLESVTRVMVSGNAVSGNTHGILGEAVDNITIDQNRFTRNLMYGISLDLSASSTVSSNRLTEDNINVSSSQSLSIVGNGVIGGGGIWVVGSQSVVIAENRLVLNAPLGVRLEISANVSVYHNVFLQNGASDDGTQNRWDDGYPSGGNYWWPDYTGVDSCSGPAQDVCPDPDGIGDTAYAFDPDTIDRYPLADDRIEFIPPEPPTLVAAELIGANAEDLRLEWLPSSDEATTGGTVEYRVMRAADPVGPYERVATIPTSGSSSYAYICVGCGHNVTDANDTFYTIRAVDSSHNFADGNRAAKHARAVAPGPNLLAIPLVLANWSLGAALQTIAFDFVRTYVASDPADPWKSSDSSGSGDLPPLAFGTAFWVDVTAAGTYTIAGLLAPDPSLSLEVGWNLVTYAAFVNRTRDESLAGVLGVARVEGFDPMTSDPYRLRVIAGGDRLVPGDGYWLLMTQRATWVQR